MLDASTDGTELIWSKGGDTARGAPDLYSYVPGAGAPTLVYRDPDRTAQLMPIAVHGGRYAFEETVFHSDGSGDWRLWYVAGAGRKPLLLDSSLSDPMDLPAPAVWLALTNERLFWNAVHESSSGPRYYLRSYEFETGLTRNLVEADAERTEFWFPNADDRGRLVYATVEYSNGNASTAGASFHVYYAEIGDGPLEPRRLDTDGTSTEPVLSGDSVIWKSVTSNAVWNSGDLSRHSLLSGSGSPVAFDQQPGVDYETAGNRFVAAWLDDDTIFEIYDLQTDRPLLIEKHQPTSPHGVVRPVAAGNLLLFIRVDNEPGANLQLCWMRLPPPD